MKTFTTCANTVDGSGFLLAREGGYLGNMLSTAANLIALGERAGINVYFDGLSPYADLFGRHPSDVVLRQNVGSAAEPSLLASLIASVEALYGANHESYMANVHTVPFDEIDAVTTLSGGIVFMEHRGTAFLDARRYEAALSRLIRRGNGVVLPGAYWLQYQTTPVEAIGPVRRLFPLAQADSVADRRSLMQQSRGHALIVGVHVRRGDYQIWRNGEFYFGLDAYVAIMRQIARCHGKDLLFVLCSNESWSPDLLAGLPVCYRSGNTYDDFIALSGCDVVMGPPSTFANWAAFLGGARRLVMTAGGIAALSDAADPLAASEPVDFPTTSCLPQDWWA